MPNAVCLTARQQKFYNYFINYYKSNGCFPNPTQAARDMNCASANAGNMYGVLLLKGVFTNGQPLTNSYKARHSTTPIQPVNIANFKLDIKPKARKAKKAAPSKNQLAALLIKLLGDKQPDFTPGDLTALSQLIS